MMLETVASRIIIIIAPEIRQYISASGLPFWSRQWSCPSIHSDIDIVARAHSKNYYSATDWAASPGNETHSLEGNRK
jgi:hypothetical protein